MNRMDEYNRMMEQLHQVPMETEGTVARARARRTRNRAIWRPLVGVAAVICLFVGTVNLSPTIAAACREIPLLERLVEAVTFRPSLQKAVENAYIQVIGQEQSQSGVTARVEHLIVDQKQVNVFYSLTSAQYHALSATPALYHADGKHVQAAVSSGGVYEEDGELRMITVDFLEEDVPSSLRLELKVHDHGSVLVEAPLSEAGWETPSEPEILTSFSFTLEFDPLFTEQGRSITLDRTVELDEQKVTFTDMEMYPSYIRLNVMEDEENTSWLTSLRFYLELENGVHVEKIANGISATGNAETPSMTSYRAESSYFENADCIRLVITGADFLQKDRERVHINLHTMETDPLPEGVELHEIRRTEHGTAVHFRIRKTELDHVQVLSGNYYDAAGNCYDIGSYSTSTVLWDQQTQKAIQDWEEETYYLEDCQWDELWVEVNYTHFWQPKNPISISLMEADS